MSLDVNQKYTMNSSRLQANIAIDRLPIYKIHFSHILSEPKLAMIEKQKKKRHSIKGHVQLSGQQVWNNRGQKCTQEQFFRNLPKSDVKQILDNPCK